MVFAVVTCRSINCPVTRDVWLLQYASKVVIESKYFSCLSRYLTLNSLAMLFIIPVNEIVYPIIDQCNQCVPNLTKQKAKNYRIWVLLGSSKLCVARPVILCNRVMKLAGRLIWTSPGSILVSR
jgi:hypothetical protein